MPDTMKNSVLIIDDSPEQIRYVSDLLKQMGCKVYAALSCDDAMLILEKQIPDLILLDIVMPGMDVFTFCRKIKSEKETSDIPVIFATAHTDKEYIGKSFAAGGSDYVTKPFIKEELLERVKVRMHLAQKQKELKRAYAELDQFCYTVTHDIKAPLYVIKQLAGILVKEQEDGNAQEAAKICGMLRQKAEYAAAMTDGLHRFSKFSYEELHIDTIDMDNMFHEIFDELCMLEHDRNISYHQDLLPTVQGDANLIHLVIQNIFTNALKFTRQKSNTIIQVSAEEKDNVIIYYITDNGIGMEEYQTEEVFQVFRKLHSDKEYEGDGIGLASVRRIMRRHGGEVAIQSKIAEGTTVKLSFLKM